MLLVLCTVGIEVEFQQLRSFPHDSSILTIMVGSQHDSTFEEQSTLILSNLGFREHPRGYCCCLLLLY